MGYNDKLTTLPILQRVGGIVVTTKVQRSAGGVLCRGCADSPSVALIVTKGGTRWQLPKGWLEEGESPQEAAQREVREETGLEGRILEDLGTIDYWFYADRSTRVHKFVTFYLMAYERGNAADFDPAEVDGALWLPIEEAIEKATFASERDILRKAKEAWSRIMASEG